MPADRSRTRLETAQLWADLVSKVLGGLAVLVAAWWTYTNFTVERTHDPTMVVTLAPSVHPLRGDDVLLNVDVFLENIGKVAIRPKFPVAEDDRDLGLEISIVEIAPLDDAKAGARPLPGATDVTWFDWTSGAGSPRPLLLKKNLLATNEDFRLGRYQLNPGVKYREPFACVVARGRLYAIRARFWADEASVADLVYVDTFTVGH
ncbi:MAG: hypothetical protein ACKOTB_03230 [Planctomycetia bacterium]